ncbi:MAG: hypothetical protein AAFO83_01755 [Cyanobacteria bacterium J06607_13]
MAIGDDIFYDPVLHRVFGSAAFLASSTYYALEAFYQHLIDQEDELTNLDAPPFFALDANVLTYKTAGDLYIQQELFQHLQGAALETTGHTNKIRVLSFQSGGYTNAIATDIGEPVVGGTTGDSGVLLDYDNLARKWWVRVDDATPSTGDTFDQGEVISITGGTGAGTTAGASATGEDLWTCVQTAGAVAAGSPYIYRGSLSSLGSKILSWWGEGNFDGNGSTASDFHINVLVKAREAGQAINSGSIVIFNRQWGFSYAHAEAALGGGGVVNIPLATEVDGNITLTQAQAENLTDGDTASIAASFGSFAADINDDDTDESYTLQVDGDSQSSANIYQALMWLAQDENSTLNGIPGDAYTSANPGTFTANVKFPFGALAAGTLVYAQGGHPINSGDGNYQSTDDGGANYAPPSQQLVGFASGLVSGDKVAAMPVTQIGGDIVKNEYAIAAATDGASTVQVSGTIAKDKPLGNNFFTIVEVETGNEYLFRYTSRTADAFTLPPGLPTGSVSSADANGVTVTDSAATFVTDGVQVGDFVFNATDGSWGNVKSVDSETQLTITKLVGGANNDWGASDAYEIGILPKTFTTGDTIYVPYAFGEATGTSFTNSVQLVDANRPVRYIARRSSSGDGANAIKRFQQDATIGAIPASRNPETLAAL